MYTTWHHGVVSKGMSLFSLPYEFVMKTRLFHKHPHYPFTGWEEVFIMAYGGIRGAVGFSLVVTLPTTIVHRLIEYKGISYNNFALAQEDWPTCLNCTIVVVG